MSASSRAVSSAAAQEPSVALFRLMAEQSPHPALLLERDLRVRWINPAAAAWLGVKSRDLVAGRPWGDLALPWPGDTEAFRQVLAGTAATLPDAARVNSDRERRTCRARLVPLREAGGPVNAILCVIEDLTVSAGNTATMPSLAALGTGAPATDTQRQLALNSAQVGSWHWDFEAGYFAVDSRWCKAMHVDPCAGTDHLERWTREIHPDDIAEVRRRRTDVESGRTDRFEAEYRILTGDSRWLWVLQRGRTIEHRPDGRAARVTGICIEIDDRKRAEVELQENESRLATALWGARAAFWQWHIPTDTTIMSPLWFAMTGYSREQWESISSPWATRVHPDDRERVTEAIRAHLRGEVQSIEMEYRIRTVSGEHKWMLMRGRVVEWDFEGKPTSAIGVSLDIDAQKHAELELLSSEARLETAVWGAGMGLWELDFRREQTRWFSDWCARLDIDPCEGSDHVARWDANLHPEDVGEAARRFADHVAGKEDYYDAEYRVRTKKGEWRWLFERGRVVERAPDGRALRMVGVCMDIDSRKETEILAGKSQRRLEVALESARGGMWDMDMSTRRMRQTDYFYRMLGVTPEEGEGDDCFWRARMHPDDRPKVRDAVQDVIDGRTELYEAEYRLQHADGSWRWVLDRGRAAERGEDGKATRLVGFMVDVTDRVHTQEALRKSEFRYRTVTQVAPGYVFEYRFVTDDKVESVWVSDGLQSIFGLNLERFREHGGFDSFVEPESLPVVKERRRRVLQGDSQIGEVVVRTATGEKKWLQVNSVPVRDPQTGAVIGAVGSAHDITTRKVAEEAVRSSEAVLRAVTDNTPDWLFLLDDTLTVRFMNRSFRQWGAEDVLGRNLLDVLPADGRAQVEQLCRRVFATREPDRSQLRHANADGTTSYFEHRVVPVIDGGRVRTITVAVTDVTERILAEQAVRESQSVLQTIAQSSSDWLALFDRDRKCAFLNRDVREQPPAHWLGHSVEEFAQEHDRERVRTIFAEVIATGEPKDFEQWLLAGDGSRRTFEVRVRAVRSDERIVGAVVNVTEVTERQTQQIALRTQARILETMREGVVLVDANNCIRLTNPTFDAMFGYRSDELLGKPVNPLVGMPPVLRTRLLRGMRDDPDGRDTLPVEFECVRRDGTRFVASCVVTPLMMGGAEHWLAVLNDVTERKRLEREIIEIANREQQRIGSDLHDGLGQDLTGVALMLRGIVAQLRKEGSATRLDVEDVINLVNNAIESTRALARGLSPVSTEQGGLAAALQTLAGKAGERYGMRVDFRSELVAPPQLAETAATHLYRIAQEALTNVVRHSRASEASIELEVARGELQLRISDNGRGFVQPGDEAAGLGLKIMRYRAQMLGGDLVLETRPDGGALVRCTCPVPQADATTDSGRHRRASS